MNKAVMIRYGEIFLKSESVQRHYLRILDNNIKNALKTGGIEHRIERHRGRILIYGDNPEGIVSIVTKIFGIIDACIAEVTEPDREIIEKKAAEIAAKSLRPGMSFAVRPKRSNMKGFTSQELGASTGDRIWELVPDLTVDLKNPDYEIFVEARTEGGLIYDRRIKGPAGLPVGTQGEVLSLISAGIDSPVAAWLVMRRGCTSSFIFFRGKGYFGRDTEDAMLENMKNLSLWCPGRKIRLYSIDLEDFYTEILDKITPRYLCLVCKRFMMHLSSLIAVRKGMYGIVMGNNLGQVASQTLANMAVTEEIVPPGLPLLQPLLTWDKEEIVDLARKIGTFREFAGDLDCAVVPKHPAVSATIADLKAEEEKLYYATLTEKCMESLEEIKIMDGEIIDSDN